MAKTAQKTVLITGTSEGGIGDALAKEFHKKGLRVFATARNLAKVQHLKELGLDVIPLDVVDQTSIQQAVKSVSAATGGKLDILVNNSGNGYNEPLLDSDVRVAKAMFDVNVFGVIEVTRAFAPLLIASQKGLIVNIGSIAGIIPAPWQGYYNASKAAVNLLSTQLRIELAPLGVTAINVTTGVVRTNFFANLEAPTLPPDSLYGAAREVLEPAMRGEGLEEGGMDVGVFAREVVGNVLRANPRKNHWVGGSAFAVWFASTFGWDTIWDLVVPHAFKIPLATSKIRAAAKST